MKYLLLIVFFLSSISSVYAQSDSGSFNIRFFAGSDTTAPSTPVLLSADPVSPNQIDIDWSPATDNYTVQGYVVSRGTSTIATTSLTSFSDTSVAASTTYSYTVRAFDAAFNYSSSSNSIATTTPDFPVVPPVVREDNSSEGTVTRIVTRDISVSPGYSTTSIAVETARPVRLAVRWGRSTDYELGYSVSEFYSDTHLVGLADLEPGTTYEYEIIASTPFGLESVIRVGKFTTLSDSDSDTPSNVRRFTAVADGKDVQLSWQLPATVDVSHVRIVRSNFGFPQYPQNGAVVYQGKAAKFTDSDILSMYSPVYYTAFVYSADGKVSSGAVAMVYAQSFAGSASEDVPSVQPPVKVVQPTTTVDESRVTIDMRLPELTEIFIEQKDRTYSLADSHIRLASQDAFLVRIPADSVAGNLKSIIGTVLDPTDNQRSYSFLLRINAGKTHYEAAIPAVAVSGESVLEVKIYDYEAYTVATYTAPLTFDAELYSTSQVIFPDMFLQGPMHWWWLFIILAAVVFLVLLIVWRHRHEDKS
jgi:hypothetical protein